MVKLNLNNDQNNTDDDSDAVIKKYAGLLNNLVVDDKSDQLLKSIQEGIKEIPIIDAVVEPSVPLYIGNKIYNLIYLHDLYTLYLSQEREHDDIDAALIVLNELTNYYVGIPDGDTNELKFYSIQEGENAKFGICIGIIKEFVDITDVEQVLNTCRTFIKLNQNI